MYTEHANIFKILADPKRLQIIDMLGTGELCGRQIQEHFNITQPTLSHDLRQMQEAGLVTMRRDGKWCYYSLNQKKCMEISMVLDRIFSTDRL